MQELFANDNGSALGKKSVTKSSDQQNLPTISEKQVEEVILTAEVDNLYTCANYYLKLLLQVEDEGDAKALSQAKAEQIAEKAEFDENFSLDHCSTKVS